MCAALDTLSKQSVVESYWTSGVLRALGEVSHKHVVFDAYVELREKVTEAVAGGVIDESSDNDDEGVNNVDEDDALLT